ALWALAWLIRRVARQQALESRSPQAEPAPANPPAPVSAPTPPPAETSREPEILRDILARLDELNAGLLLSPEQIEVKRRRHQAEASERLERRFSGQLSAGELDAAGETLRRLTSEVPDSSALGSMRTRLDEARAAAQAEDIRWQTARAGELMAAADFPAAVKLAEDLLAKYPSSPEAIALLDRVHREQDAFVTERRRSLYAEVGRAASKRKWREALAAASKLLEAYPEGLEADAVRIQLRTLEENARLEEAREMRDRFRDLLSRRRYAEALEAAREVLRRFPDTQAAADLREQMPRLEELARNGGNHV
ncbi:MAG TPA: hypothetical protein DCX07_13065, partial [Phycisphaerales bacterium]|nr:hypothetical protein [Phycisphaerales bacterium]